MTIERIAGLFEAHPWVFAKTMPENPHEYTLRKRWKSQEDFDWAVQFIRQNGYSARFGKYRYKYLDVGGHSYWTMGWPVAKTILINRVPVCRVDRPSAGPL